MATNQDVRPLFQELSIVEGVNSSLAFSVRVYNEAV